MAVTEHQIFGGAHFHIFETRHRKTLVVDEGAISPEKEPLPMDLLAGKTSQADFSQSWKSVATVRINPSLA